MAVRVEGGGDVNGGGVVGIDAGNARLDDVASFPEFGAFVHVLVEPLVTEGKVEFLNEKGQLGVEGS